MLLSDTMITQAREDGRLILTASGPEYLNPASIDLTLGNDFLTVMELWGQDYIDPRNINAGQYSPFRVDDDDDFYTLYPQQFVLGTTRQIVHLDPKQMSMIGNAKYCHRPPLVGRVEGKSSLGRIGLMVHITAGFIDPGFCGTITLEFFNCSPLPIRLYPGMRICQISFFETGTVDKDYSMTGKYQDQLTVTASRGVK